MNYVLYLESISLFKTRTNRLKVNCWSHLAANWGKDDNIKNKVLTFVLLGPGDHFALTFHSSLHFFAEKTIKTSYNFIDQAI